MEVVEHTLSDPKDLHLILTLPPPPVHHHCQQLQKKINNNINSLYLLSGFLRSNVQQLVHVPAIPSLVPHLPMGHYKERKIYPLSPKSDEHQISPCNIDANVKQSGHEY